MKVEGVMVVWSYQSIVGDNTLNWEYPRPCSQINSTSSEVNPLVDQALEV